MVTNKPNRGNGCWWFTYHKDLIKYRTKLLNADWLKQSTFFLNCSTPMGINYSLMIGRAAKILAYEGQSPASYILLLYSLCAAREMTSFYRFFGIGPFKQECLCLKFLEIKCYSNKLDYLEWKWKVRPSIQ